MNNKKHTNPASPIPKISAPKRDWKAEAFSFALRAVTFAAAWWVLAEGHLTDYGMPAAFAILSALVSRSLCPPGTWRWHPAALVIFVPWFLWNSFLGGLDVAIRALRPNMNLHPDIIEMDIRVPEKPALLLAWIVSLLPGTACIHLREGFMCIHVLDKNNSPMEKTRHLERRLAGLCE